MISKKKISLGLITVATIATPIIAVASCGKSETDLLKKGDRDKQTNLWENLPTLTSINWKPNKPIGDKAVISNIENWMKSNNIKGFNASPRFVKQSSEPFNRSPKTIILNSPKINDLKNLPAKEFGLYKIVEYVKQTFNTTPTIELIESSKDDATGTLGVKLHIDKTIMEFKISGFTITKDINLKGENFKTINEIIEGIDKAVNLGFEKSVAVMTPQELKQELIDLYNETNGGRLTIIGTYKGTESVIALDRNIMLKKLINAFGDVSKTKRGPDDLASFGLKMIHKAPKFSAGFGTILVKYAKLLEFTGTNQHSRGDYVAGLFRNISPKVFEQFPDLITLFDSVADGVKNMQMVKDWADNNTNPGNGQKWSWKDPSKNNTSEIDRLNFALVEWVLDSGTIK